MPNLGKLFFYLTYCFNLLLLVGLVMFVLTLNAYLQYGTVNVSSICFSRNLCLCFVIITAFAYFHSFLLLIDLD